MGRGGGAEPQTWTRLSPPRRTSSGVAAITAANRLSVTIGRSRLTGVLKRNTDVSSGEASENNVGAK